jgi:virulence-associated protein VapD
MFAIAFDLIVDETRKRHPKGVAQAYNDIGACPERFGFHRVQGTASMSANARIWPISSPP